VEFAVKLRQRAVYSTISKVGSLAGGPCLGLGELEE